MDLEAAEMCFFEFHIFYVVWFDACLVLSYKWQTVSKIQLVAIANEASFLYFQMDSSSSTCYWIQI